GGAVRGVRAAIDGTVPSRFLFDPHAVGHVGDDRAADRAMRADILADRHRGAGSRRWTGLRLADSTDRQSSDRGEAAGDDARSAQKTATIEIATCLRPERCIERAAAKVALCPLDQHDPVLSLRWIAVDAIEGLHLGRIGLVVRLALVREAAGLPRSVSASARRGGADRHYTEQIAAPDFGVEAIFHGTASTTGLSPRHESRAAPLGGLRDNLICSMPAYFNDLAASVAILRTWPRQRRGLRASFAPVVGGQKRCIGEQLRCLAQGCANHGNAAKATSMPSVLFCESGIVA